MINKYPYTDFNEYNLDWCITRIRDLTEEWKSVHTEWTDVQTEWENYKSFIDNYFETLDVQENIDAKINEMISDGSFQDVIRPFFEEAINDIPSIVSAWLNDNIVQETGYVIDDTLTIHDAAADAQATGFLRDDIKAVASLATKNVLDPKQFLLASGWAYDPVEESYYGILSDLEAQYGPSTDGMYIYYPFKLNTQYTMSFKAYTNSPATSGNSMQARFYYTDATYTSVYLAATVADTFQFKYLVSTAGKTIEKIAFYHSGNVSNVIHIKEFMIEEGDLYTHYEPFTITANDSVARMNLEILLKNLAPVKLKFLRGVLNANGNMSTGDYAYAVIPKNVIWIYIDDSLIPWASFGLYKNNTYFGKFNSHQNIDAISANGWWNFTGQIINIKEMCEKNDADYVALSLQNTSDPITTDRKATDIGMAVHAYGTPEYDIPSFFESNIATSVENAKDDMGAAGKNGYSFIFVTDVHYYHNAGLSPYIVKHVQDKTKIQDVILGGDMIDGGTHDKAGELELLHDVMDMYYDPASRRRYVFGNHDSNTVGQVYDTQYHFSFGEVFMATQETQRYIVNGYTPNNFTNYYFDDIVSKTRVIVFDSRLEGQNFYPSETAWLDGVLNDTPSDYHIIIVMHIWYGAVNTPAQQGTAMFAIVDAWNAAHNNQIRALFGGHAHIDDVYYSTGGTPLVLTTCDAIKNVTEEGTSSCQAIDIITVDYGNNVINCRRIGRGTDRDVNML